MSVEFSTPVLRRAIFYDKPPATADPLPSVAPAARPDVVTSSSTQTTQPPLFETATTRQDSPMPAAKPNSAPKDVVMSPIAEEPGVTGLEDVNIDLGELDGVVINLGEEDDLLGLNQDS